MSRDESGGDPPPVPRRVPCPYAYNNDFLLAIDAGSLLVGTPGMPESDLSASLMAASDVLGTGY